MGFAVFPQQMGWSFLFIDSAIRWLGGSDLELGVFIFPIDSLFNGDPISYLEVPNHLIAVVHIPTIPFPPNRCDSCPSRMPGLLVWYWISSFRVWNVPQVLVSAVFSLFVPRRLWKAVG